MSLAATLLVVAVPLAAADAPGTRQRLEALAQETFALVTDPGQLPIQVREKLARELRQPRLRMAVAGEPYASGDAPDDRFLAPDRLILAGVSERHAVVHFETGGQAARSVMVFALTARGTAIVWSGKVRRRFGAPVEFEQALKDGRLFEEEGRPSPP